MVKIVIVGGGYAGFCTAWHLERLLRPDEAEVVVVDPRLSMTHQPFLPEVAAGGVEARHAAVSLRRHGGNRVRRRGRHRGRRHASAPGARHRLRIPA